MPEMPGSAVDVFDPAPMDDASAALPLSAELISDLEESALACACASLLRMLSCWLCDACCCACPAAVMPASMLVPMLRCTTDEVVL